MKRTIFLLVLAAVIANSLIQEGNAGNYCSGKGDGNYPDPDNCNGYISCVDSRIVYKRPCPKGLVWSDSVKRCEWPSKAKPPCRQGCLGNKLSKLSCGVLTRDGDCKHSFIRKLCCRSCG